MKNIYISGFSFDLKVNPFCKEKTVAEAMTCSSGIHLQLKEQTIKKP